MNEKEKSAILKGQTLVNLINYKGNFDGREINSDNTFKIDATKPFQELIIGKEYTFIAYVSQTAVGNMSVVAIEFNEKDTGIKRALCTISNPINGVNKVKFTVPSNYGSYLHSYIKTSSIGGSVTVKGMIIEGDHTNIDIPYFEGMQSVKMPVLKTTGKNLFDGIWSTTDITYSGRNIWCENYIEVNSNAAYYYSRGLNGSGWNCTRQYDADFNLIKESNMGFTGGKITLEPNTKYIKIATHNTHIDEPLMISVTKEGGYEPFKSNILTVNEPIELRGIGDVQDTLDCLTGEVTERIGEIVLDGGEDWQVWTGANVTEDVMPFMLSRNHPNINSTTFMCDKFTTYKNATELDKQPNEGIALNERSTIYLRINKSKLSSADTVGLKQYLTQNPITVQYELETESIKTVDLIIQDQDNQPQERMKLFPNGYINTSSSTFPPILELKGITHNNKLNMTTTNGTNNTQLATLDNLALDGIICRDGTVVRDSYDVESGLYTKRVFRFTIDEEFINKYTWNITLPSNYQVVQFSRINPLPKSYNAYSVIGNNLITAYAPDSTSVELATNNNIYIRIRKEELKSYDVDGLLDWIKRNGAIEVAYQLAEPQIIHMQPNMTPYVSTRPYQGSIESQGNILESSYLDYTSEQSIISPKPLGDGDVLKWEQGSQCYVYENDKEYIPLVDYNQPMGTVLDLEEEDGEQYVENLDGGEVVVDVPFKEKAVYERHLTPYEDKVIYPTQDKLDPTGKIEVDYICGETWQNPNDLSDIRHVGTLREDGQYDVTIRRSGDDEIRLMDGITHISLDRDGLNPSEFELTYFNSGGVEVGKYGDTSHMLEDCVLDSKLETGIVYGDTQFNSVHKLMYANSGLECVYENNKYIYRLKSGTVLYSANIMVLDLNKALVNGEQYRVDVNVEQCPSDLTIAITANNEDSFSNVIANSKVYSGKTGVGLHSALITVPSSGYKNLLIRLEATGTDSTVFSGIKVTRVSTNEIICNHALISSIVNGFTTVGKNLFGFNDRYEVKNSYTKHEILDMNSIIVSPDTTSLNWINAGFYNYYLPHKTTDYFIISRKEEIIHGNPYDTLNLYDADDDGQMIRIEVWEHNGYKYDLVQFKKDGERANIRFYCGSNEKMGTIKYSDIQITKYSQRPSRINVEFEPYQSVQYTLPTPITLRKVGDVCDTFDVVSGVETRNTKKVVLDGSENWSISAYGSSTTGHSTIFNFSDNYISFPNGVNGTSHNYVLYSNGFTNMDGQAYGTAEFKGENGINKCNIYNSHIFVHIDNSQLETVDANGFKKYLQQNPLTVIVDIKTQTIQHTLIPSTVETIQEPTFILPQPLRSVPNGICDRLYWDENKGHYCIEKRIGVEVFDGVNNFNLDVNNGELKDRFSFPLSNSLYVDNAILCYYTNSNVFPQLIYNDEFNGKQGMALFGNGRVYFRYNSKITNAQFKQLLIDNPVDVIYSMSKSQIIDLPHLNKKLTLPTQPDTLPIGYKVEHIKANPQLGLTIPYKQLNYPSRPQNIDFKMDIADYVLTWDDVKEARQYNVILNDRVIATVKEPQWNSGEEMYGYIMVEAQNELAENLSEELYIKTVPNAPAQLTVGHNPMTDYYDFEISFIKTSAIAEYYTVQYRIDDGDWVYKTIQSDEIDPNSKVLWKFSVYEIHEQIEVWATATNDIGTNDILPTATYYMSPTPQWTYRINSKELFVRWMDDSPYDTQYKLRYQYKSDGIYRYAYFEGDKQEIGKLYEALIPLADDEEVSIALCVISEKENLYTKPIKASKELDPNIKPPKNFNYHWLARGLIEFYWEDNYDVDVEYEAIVEHRLTSGNNEWITDTRIFSATDTEGTGAVYRLEYQLEDLEEIRVKVRMRWAMNETEWSESLTTVFIPVEGNPPQWIRRTQTQEGLLVEWEAQEYVDSYHVYVMSNGEELQHLETMDNFIYVDLDYSNPIDIEIYEATRFSGGIQSDPTESMRFRPTMDKHQLIHDVVTPDTLTYEIEVDTVQKGIKERQVIHDINTTPNVKTKEPMDVAIKSPFTLSFHPLQLDVHQSGSKYYGDTELHIKTLDVKSRDAIEVLTFERITDQYGVDFTVYTPSASKYPITLEVNRVRIVCFGDSLTSGHPGFWE